MYEEILAEIKKRNEEKMKAEKPKYDKRVYVVPRRQRKRTSVNMSAFLFPFSAMAGTIFWRLPVIPWLMRVSIAEIWSLSG